MNFVSWNCWGNGAKYFGRLMKDICQEYSTSLLFLLETHASRAITGWVTPHLGFESSFVQDAQGHVGGIWCLWKVASSNMSKSFKAIPNMCICEYDGRMALIGCLPLFTQVVTWCNVGLYGRILVFFLKRLTSLGPWQGTFTPFSMPMRRKVGALLQIRDWMTIVLGFKPSLSQESLKVGVLTTVQFRCQMFWFNDECFITVIICNVFPDHRWMWRSPL